MVIRPSRASTLPQFAKTIASHVAQTNAPECWLLQLIDHPVADGLRQLGFTLRTRWPRNWSAEIDQWMGPRFYFAHQSRLRSKNTAILCSHLGDAREARRWPTLLESSLRDIASRGENLLIAPGTTLHKACREFAQRAQLSTTELVSPTDRQSLIEWLTETLESPKMDRILISPRLPDSAMNTSEPPSNTEPLSDRSLIACADRVITIYVRQKGRVEKLIHQRLEKDTFPPGSVFAHLDPTCNSKKLQERNRRWLDRGAVGWYIPESEAWFDFPNRCHTRAAKRTTRQLTGSLSESAAVEWNWLVHCTRGLDQLPDETGTSFRLRQRVDGAVETQHPLRTLHRICRSGRIKSFAHLNRAGQAVVSFSARPVLELLAERRYQSHLRRWNWESYGLLISREVIEELGGRPVLYGTDADYADLNPEQQAYFQPLGVKQDWSREEEWRLVGDLDLGQLPSDAIRLFVPSRREANYLASLYGWSVFWTEDVDNSTVL